MPDKGYFLQLGNMTKKVRKDQEYLLLSIPYGEENDEKLLEKIQKNEKIGEAASGFVLAGFLIEYAEFIAEDVTHYEIY